MRNGPGSPSWLDQPLPAAFCPLSLKLVPEPRGSSSRSHLQLASRSEVEKEIKAPVTMALLHLVFCFSVTMLVKLDVNSWVKVILLLQPPQSLRLQPHTIVPGSGFCF